MDILFPFEGNNSLIQGDIWCHQSMETVPVKKMEENKLDVSVKQMRQQMCEVTSRHNKKYVYIRGRLKAVEEEEKINKYSMDK